MKESGFPDYRSERIVKYNPRLLSAGLEDGIKPKIVFFRGMGLSSDCISKMISTSPMTFRLSLKDNIIPSVALLGSNDVAARVISHTISKPRCCPPSNSLKVSACPWSRYDQPCLVIPWVSHVRLKGLKKSAETAKEMGVDASSKRFIYAVLVIVCSSSEGWKLKLQAMRSLGFSDSDLLSMFREAPVVFMISVEKMKTIIKLLLDTNKYTMSSVVDCPWSLQPCIEKRYMPRLQTLGTLESRNLIQDWPSLSKLSTSTDAKFFKEFGIRFDAEFVSRVAPKLSDLKKPENACSALSFLRESGFSDNGLETIVKCRSQLLSASLEKGIKPKINFFREMGLSPDCISKLISGNPAVFGLSLNDNIIPSVVLLERLLGSKDEVARVIQKAPRIMLYNFETTVLPTIEFFKGLGVPLEKIRTVFVSYPTAFSRKLEVLKKSAETAKEMGVDATSNRFVYAVIVIVCFSNEGWKLKLQAMRSLGFSDSDILIMFRKAPPVFMISVEKMKTIIKLLLDTKKYTMSSVVECPLSLQSSIEKRCMPRLQTLGILESRNLIQDWPSLSKLSRSTDAKFYEEFVIPYSDKVSAVCSVDKSATVEED